MPGRILGIATDPQRAGQGILYGVDVRTGGVPFRKPVPYAVPEWDRYELERGTTEFRQGPDGRVWTYLDGAFVRIHIADARVEVLGRLEIPGVLAFSGRDVYLGGTEALRRLRNLVP